MASNSESRPTYATEYIKGDWDKSVFLGNAHVDNLMSALLNLGGECWAMRRRLMVVEKLLATKCGIDAADIEGYLPDEQDQAAWDLKRDEFIDRVFAVLVRASGNASGLIDTAHPLRQPPRAAGDPS
jgi:hypothetical protein